MKNSCNSIPIPSSIKKWAEDLNRHLLPRQHTTGQQIYEKMFNFTSCYTKNNKGWRSCGEKGSLTHCWWECKLVQSLWSTVCRFLKKLGIDLLFTNFDWFFHMQAEYLLPWPSKLHTFLSPLCSLKRKTFKTIWLNRPSSSAQWLEKGLWGPTTWSWILTLITTHWLCHPNWIGFCDQMSSSAKRATQWLAH